MESKTETSLFQLASEVAEAKGLVLVDAGIKNTGGRDVVVVTIHKEGGVGVEDCADVSRELDVLLEAEGLFKGPFTLEVSSPGLTRPLKTVEDFKMNISEEIRVKYTDEQNTLNSTIGRLESVNDTEIILITREGAGSIKIDAIKSAKLEITI